MMYDINDINSPQPMVFWTVSVVVLSQKGCLPSVRVSTVGSHA